MSRAMYFADDKDIRDLLDVSKRKLTDRSLREFMARRGLLVSRDMSKDDIFNIISMWTLDWDDLGWLIQATHREDRAERVTTSSIDLKVTPDQVLDAAKKLEQTKAGKRIDALKFTKSTAGTVTVAVAYTELDQGKTRLRQKRQHEGSLIIDSDGDRISVRHEANERMEGLAESFYDEINALLNVAAKPRRIALSHLAGAKARTRFFQELIGSMTGLTPKNVTKVSVHRSGSAHDDDVDQDVEEMAAQSLSGAVLRGGSLLTSPEFQMLREQFYICGLEWQSQEDKADGNLVLLEASFTNAEDCTGFKYRARGIIERKKRGSTTEFVHTSRACTAFESSRYAAMIEGAADAALTEAEKEAVDEGHAGSGEDESDNG